MAEIILGLLGKFDADGRIEGGLGLWLSRLALNFGHAADGVIERHHRGGGEK